MREESGSAVLGAVAVRVQKPFDQPARPKKSPAPLFMRLPAASAVSSMRRTICSWQLGRPLRPQSPGWRTAQGPSYGLLAFSRAEL